MLRAGAPAPIRLPSISSLVSSSAFQSGWGGAFRTPAPQPNRRLPRICKKFYRYREVPGTIHPAFPCGNNLENCIINQAIDGYTSLILHFPRLMGAHVCSGAACPLGHFSLDQTHMRP